MTSDPISGERLQHEDALYAADLARHRAAYRFAIDSARDGRIADLGCGTGYGTAELSNAGLSVFGLDRVAPSRSARRSAASFLRADLAGVPLAPGSIELVVSFQVIEHLADPTPYLQAIAALLRPDGLALITTPNILQSEGENPYHVHEYEAGELSALLGRYFADVELRGVGASEAAARYHADRLKRIRRITRLDPLGLRNRLPSWLLEWLFARLSLLVRHAIRSGDGIPELTPDDFPIGPPDGDCLDLLALCRAPRTE